MSWRRGPQSAASSSEETAKRSGAAAGSNPSSSSFGEYLQPFSTAVSQSFSGSHGLTGSQTESTRLLADLAPHIMRPRILAAANNASSTVTSAVSSNALVGFLPIPLSFKGGQGFSLTQPARNLVRIGNALRQGPVSSADLLALESSHQILADAALSMSAGYADQEEQEQQLSLRTYEAGAVSEANQVSLLRGFEATIPSATQSRDRRRRERTLQGPKLGLKSMGDRARGLLTDIGDDSIDEVVVAAAGASAQPDFVDREKRKEKRSQIRAKHKDIPLSEADLLRQEKEVRREKDDIDIRRRLIHKEISTVEMKMAALQVVKDGLTRSLLDLKEEELELEDEAGGILEMLSLQRHRKSMPGAGGKAPSTHSHQKSQSSRGGPSSPSASSRRRKGPLFLPSEHDELPSGVAFMTLAGHTAPIASLDFSEPYGALVSSGTEGDATVRVWDLCSGLEVGHLRHDSVVKALQVEDELCVTGGADSRIKIWDLRKVEDWETRLQMRAEGSDGAGAGEHAVAGDRTADGGDRDESDPRLKTLEGHSKEVTALYFDETCLVSGANDKTLRQWDLNTGQCVLTMDILWAISNPMASQALGDYSPPHAPSSPTLPSTPTRMSSTPLSTPQRRRAGEATGLHTGLGGHSSVSDWSGNFSYPTPACSDGSWELYTDFVGPSAIQFWGYALASGSADGAVRMWDMRTGQSHRTLLGHTAPVTCLQFDEQYVVSGSLDKSIRIWDLRTGGIADTIKYEYPVSSLQFDSRKIMATTGETGIKVSEQGVTPRVL